MLLISQSCFDQNFFILDLQQMHIATVHRHKSVKVYTLHYEAIIKDRRLGLILGLIARTRYYYS